MLEYVPSEGRDVLVPLRDKIRELRDQLFTSGSAAQPVTGSDASLMKAEAAKVLVLNGSGKAGLGCDTKAWLLDQGVNVTDCTNADRSDYANTVILDYTGKPYTANWLKPPLGAATILRGNDPTSTVDINVIARREWPIPTRQ